MRYIWLICLFFVAHFLKAQEELSLFFHPDVIQSGQLQPAYAPQGTFNIGFGSTYFHLDARGPRILSSSGTINYLRDLAGGITQNYLSSDASFNAFDLGFVKDGWYMRAGYQMHSNGYFNFRPDLAKLFVAGNANEIGKTIEFGPSLYFRQTSEAYIGASYLIDDYYRFGANLKFISGALDISTPETEFNLTTGEEFYEITVENDYLVNTSYNSLEFSLREALPFSNPFQDNIGVSADFGFQYIADRFDISASLLDVGLIRWRSNPINYRSEGKYTFEGFTFDDATVDTLEVLLDTLQQVFDVGISFENYTTFTPIKIVIGGEYHLNTVHLGAVLYGEWKQNRFLPAIGLNVRKRVWNFWDVGVSYAYKNNTYSNLGLSSVMNLSPVQLYALSDNVVGIFLPWNRIKMNFRVGANINVGRAKKPKTISDTAALY